MVTSAVAPTPVNRCLDLNRDWLRERLGLGVSCDVIWREIEFAGRRAGLLAVRGLFRDDLLERVTSILQHTHPDEASGDALPDDLLRRHVSSLDVETVDTLDDVARRVLAGFVALLLAGVEAAIALRMPAHAGRAPSAGGDDGFPHGSPEVFTGALVVDTALVRRRVRDAGLRVERVTAGRRSPADVGLLYIQDVADPELVERAREAVRAVDRDGPPLAGRALERALSGRRYGWSPFPVARYTERPDVAALALLEGRVALVADAAPVATILPSTFWDHLAHPREHCAGRLTGFWTRAVTCVALLAAMFLVPGYLVVARQGTWWTGWTGAAGAPWAVAMPLWVQFALSEAGLELVRAAVTSSFGATAALNVIVGLLLGQLAIAAGLLAWPTVLYATLAAVATFAIPSAELRGSVRAWRLAAILVAGILGGWGLAALTAITLLLLLRTRSLGRPYLWPVAGRGRRASRPKR